MPQENEIKKDTPEQDQEEVWNEQARIESNKFWREWWIECAGANGVGTV